MSKSVELIICKEILGCHTLTPVLCSQKTILKKKIQVICLNRQNKNKNLHIRLTDKQYANIKTKANELGISVTNYILKMTEQGKVVVIEPKDLAAEIRELNRKLSKLEQYPVIKAQELRDMIGEEVVKLNEILKKG